MKLETNEDVQTIAEMDTISKMIKRAEKEGLLAEVIYTMAQNNTENVVDKCYHALYYWDC